MQAMVLPLHEVHPALRTPYRTALDAAGGDAQRLVAGAGGAGAHGTQQQQLQGGGGAGGQQGAVGGLQAVGREAGQELVQRLMDVEVGGGGVGEGGVLMV